MHEIHLLGAGVAPGHRRQHRVPQPQGADLHGERVRVRCRDLGERELACHDLPDVRKSYSQVTQGPHEIQTREGVGAVEAVAAGLRPVGGTMPRSE